MFLLTGGLVQNSITQLFQDNPHPKLETVLSDQNLSISVRAEIPQLVDYIVTEDVLETLLKLSLTDEKPLGTDSEKFVRNAVFIFSANSKALQDKLQMSHKFIQYLKNCIEFDISNNLKLCGHFQRIMESMIKHTNAGFLENFDGLCDYLIEHLDVLALKELLCCLMTDFSEAFQDDDYTDVVYELVKSVKGKNGYFSIVLMRDIIKRKHSVISFFQDPKVFRYLLKVAVSNKRLKKKSIQKTDLFKIQIFQLIELIAKDYNPARAIIVEFKKFVRFDVNKINGGMIASLAIFRYGINELIPAFFKEPSITILNNTICDIIKEMSDLELTELIDKNDLPAKIIANFDSNLVNGHLTTMAILLNERKNLSKKLQSDEWKAFVYEKLKPRITNFESQANEPTPEEKPFQFNINTRKAPAGAFRSFSCGSSGGIKNLVKFTQDQVNKSQTLKKPHSSSHPGIFEGSLLSFLNGDNNDDSPLLTENNSAPRTNNQFNSSSLLGPSILLNKTKVNHSGVNLEKVGRSTLSSLTGIKQGFSFSIPTVYQADDTQSPMVC